MIAQKYEPYSSSFAIEFRLWAIMEGGRGEYKSSTDLAGLMGRQSVFDKGPLELFTFVPVTLAPKQCGQILLIFGKLCCKFFMTYMVASMQEGKMAR